MPLYTCLTCAAQYAAAAPPPACRICEDDRQYVGAGGQRWATREELQEQGFHNTLEPLEPGTWAVGVEPKLGIGQQAYLVQTPEGNLLWDCPGFLLPSFVQEVAALGGIQAIAISHPHFYASCADWAEAFDCQVHLHEVDREWVTRPSPRHAFWGGDALEPLVAAATGATAGAAQEPGGAPGAGFAVALAAAAAQGLTRARVVRLGGHFPGSSVLLWEGARDGAGVLFSGDTVFPTPNGGVSFMYSFPNLLPLPAAQVARIAAALDPARFERLYGPFQQPHIKAGADAAVQRSAALYRGLLDGSVRRRYI